MIQTDQQYPSVSSQNKALKINADGSVDVFFGPQAPAGEQNNWIQTVPGKSWNILLRLYGPLQPFFDKTWPQFWEAEVYSNVRYWHLADMPTAPPNVCFKGKSGRGAETRQCRLLTQSGQF